MYEGKTVAVVVPAHNEELLVGSTVASIPSFVDRIFVVDDASQDATVECAVKADPRVVIIAHERNLGVGAAIVSGYKGARDESMDVTCVMAADGQMDPNDLETLVRAVATGECHYAKANRLFTGHACVMELLLVDAQFEAVHVFGDRLQALAHRGLVAAHRLQLLVAARALGLGAPERDAGLGDRGVDRGERLRAARRRPGAPPRAGRGGSTARRAASAAACRSASNCASMARMRASSARTRSFAVSSRSFASTSASRAASSAASAPSRAAVSSTGRGVGARGSSACLGRVGGALGVGDALLGVRRGLPQALGVGLGGLGLHAGAVELLGALGELRVELAQRGERALGLVLRLLDDLALLGELEAARSISARTSSRRAAARSRSAMSSMRLCLRPEPPRST